MSAHFSYSLPQEEDIDLASLLITEPVPDINKRSSEYPIGKGSPSFSPSRIMTGASAARKASPSFRRPSAGVPVAERPVGRSLFDDSSSVGGRVGSERSGSVANAAVGAADTARDQQAQSTSRMPAGNHGNGTADLFLCRESFLVGADFCKVLTDTLLKLERGVDRDGDFDTKALDIAFQQGNLDCRMISGAPRESEILREALQRLGVQVKALLRGLARGRETAAEMYHSQLKKMREVCNQSIRSAIQADRAQNGVHMTQMKEMIEVERDRSLSDIKREMGEHKKVAAGLKEEVQRLHEQAAGNEDERAREQRRHEQQLEEMDGVHRKALRTLQAQLENEKEHELQNYKKEIQKLQENFEVSKKRQKDEYESQQRSHRQHETEIRDMLNSEIDRLKEECAQCRLQLLDITSQASTERDKLLQRFDQEKNVMETNFQKAQAEGVQALARIRGEVADRVRRLQEEDMKNKEIFQETFDKERQDLISNHIFEIDSLEEKQRKDIRRLEAQLEVRHAEEISKLRKVHEQEVKRLITDNDRLHRSLLAKSKVSGAAVIGGMQQLRADLDSSANISRRAESRQYSPFTAAPIGRLRSSLASPYTASAVPGSSEQNRQKDALFTVNEMNRSGVLSPNASGARDPESPPPSPPRPSEGGDATVLPGSNSSSHRSERASYHSPTTPFAALRESYNDDDESCSSEEIIEDRAKIKAAGNKINWGSLQESIDIQEGRRQTPTRSNRLPDSFVLEEALKSAKYSGHNITTTATAVGSYMNKLQDYLEGSEAGDTLSDGSMQRQLNAAADRFAKYQVQTHENNMSLSSEDSLEE